MSLDVFEYSLCHYIFPCCRLLSRDASDKILQTCKSLSGSANRLAPFSVYFHCPLTNCLDLDFLPHLLDCRVLQGAVQRSPSIRYSDVFSEDLEKQVEVTTLYSQLLAARDKLLPPDRDEPGNDDLPVHQLQNNAGALH